MLADSAYMLVFRIVHITAGVLWVGSVFLFTTSIAPAAAAIAPAGAPLMGELLGKRRMLDRIIGLGVITVIAGLFLYWHDWHLFQSFGDWVTSRFGGSLTIGMMSALIALSIGGSLTRPNVRRMLALGAQVAASGAPPTAEVAAELGRDPAPPEDPRARRPWTPVVRGRSDVGGALPLTPDKVPLAGRGRMAERRRSERALASVTAGVVIGVVEVVLAISFAALVFGGYLAQFLPDGIGLYLVAAAITLAIFAWRAGARGVVGGLQGTVVAVLAVVATTTALHTFGSSNRAFVTVVAATMVVTVLTGIAFLVIGTFKRGNLIRFVPYPVVGGFLAGTGWLLLKGGIYVASGEEVHLSTIGPWSTRRRSRTGSRPSRSA